MVREISLQKHPDSDRGGTNCVRSRDVFNRCSLFEKSFNTVHKGSKC